MNSTDRLCVKLIHCGNINIANPQDRSQKNMFFMPMGLFPLADALRKNTVDMELIHLDLEPGKSIQDILDFRTLDAVGFDFHWINQGLAVLETAALIKKIKPGVFIFLGGYTASLFAREILSDYPQVDAIIRGDGEIPIVELCQTLQQRKKEAQPPGPGSLEQVQNLAWRNGKEKIRCNDFSYVGTAEQMEQLDFAAVDLLRNWQVYRAGSRFWTHFEPFKSTPVFLLENGRGCQYACVFCGGNREAQKRMNNRTQPVFRSVDSVLATIKKALSLGFQTFYTCMEFEGSNQWYIRLFNRLKQEKIKINYVYGSWRLPSKPLIDALSESCDQVLIEISPETSNNHLRKKNKDPRLFYTNQQMEECLDYIDSKNNIKVQLYFGYYLASDTRETIAGTLHFAVNMLVKYHRFLEAEYSNFSTDPGSLFFFYPEKYNIHINVRNFNDYIKYLKENYVEKKGQSADMILFLPKTISPGEHAEIHRKMMFFNYLFSSYKKSVSYILEKTGTPETILRLLEETDLGPDANNKFPPHKTRDRLMENCKKKDIPDVRLSEIISRECDNQKAKPWQSTGSNCLYLELDDYGEEKVLLSAKSRVTQKDIDFDLD